MESIFIPITLAIVGYFITKAIEKYKLDNEFRKNSGLKRFESYKDLWVVSEYSIYLNNKNIDKNKLREKLKEWYYKEGNGLWIRVESSDILLSLIKQLKGKITDDEVKTRLSALRTQLKIDVMTYTKDEAGIEIGNK